MADVPVPRTDSDRASRYLVAARKYRPQTFGDLVAQEHVANTLRNALQSDRLAHAYLFSGPRGVGKTTAARVLAKAVNCQTPPAERESGEPCRTCTSCRAFEEGRSLNVIEVDAASNNKVDDIRELRETVRIPPQGATKKVYILDEVHMLSASAFNALLKTLEEPPPYVLFIFATTEPHKVLPTILSRTQRFDFRRIAVPEIVGRLREICEQENITADEESLLLLARRGDGALRDALSLFDQAVSLCGTTLEAGALREALGVVNQDVFFEVTSRSAGRDRAGLLTLVDRLVRRGHDLQEFTLGLAEHLRNLFVARSTTSGELIEGSDATRERYLQAAKPWSEADLLHLLMLTDACATDLRNSRQPRLTLELSLLKMASLEPAADLDSLQGIIQRMENALTEGRLTAVPEENQTPPKSSSDEEPPQKEPPQTASSGASSPSDNAPRKAYTSSDSPSHVGEPPAASLGHDTPNHPPSTAQPSSTLRPPPASDAVSRKTDAKENEAPDSSSDDNGGPLSSTTTPPSPAAALPKATEAPHGSAGLFGPPALKRRRGSSQSLPDTSTAEASAASGDGVMSPRPPADPHFGVSLPRVRDVWPEFTARVREERVQLGALLSLARPERVRRGAVEVHVPDDFTCEQLRRDSDVLATHLCAVAGEDAPQLRFVVAEAATAETTSTRTPFEILKDLRQEHPVVRALFERFQANIVW